MHKKTDPGRTKGAAGTGVTFKAGELNVFPVHSTFDGEMHHALRLERLRIRHGIHGPIISQPGAPRRNPRAATGAPDGSKRRPTC